MFDRVLNTPATPLMSPAKDHKIFKEYLYEYVIAVCAIFLTFANEENGDSNFRIVG